MLHEGAAFFYFSILVFYYLKGCSTLGISRFMSLVMPFKY
jgi:hypothetical protein